MLTYDIISLLPVIGLQSHYIMRKYINKPESVFIIKHYDKFQCDNIFIHHGIIELVIWQNTTMNFEYDNEMYKLAIKEGYFNIIKYLFIYNKPNFMYYDYALHHAINYKQIHISKWLISQMNIFIYCINIVICKEKIDLIILMAERTKDKKYFYTTVATYAARYNKVNMFTRFIKLYDNTTKKSIIDTASEYGSLDIIKLFIFTQPANIRENMLIAKKHPHVVAYYQSLLDKIEYNTV